jgi:uncharacterized membrane protein
MKLIYTFIISLLLVLHGYRKKSLSTSGSSAAFFVGVGTIQNDWSVFAVVLLVFYFTGSRLTKVSLCLKRIFMIKAEKNIFI